jgi:holin-like protein
MQVMRQLTLLAAIGFCGTILAALLPIPFPGSIMSLLLLFFLLIFKVVKVKQIETVANFFLAHMAIFFIAPIVEIIEHFSLLGSTVLTKFLLVAIISTFITFFVTVGAVKLALLLKGENK